MAFTKDEVRAFKKAFKVSDAEMRDAARVFNLAKQDKTGYETCAEQLVTVFKGDRKMLEYVLEGLFHIAKADEVLHPQEEKFLGQVAKHLGFTDAEFACMKARHTVAHERNPYEVLGVKPSVSDEELKSQYRRLTAQNNHTISWRVVCQRSWRPPNLPRFKKPMKRSPGSAILVDAFERR
jgi:DnaJ like chaperone protein